MGGSSWPARQITQKIKLNAVQKGTLSSITQLSARMQKLILATCPQQMPATPAARLDAALDRLDGLFYAAKIMQPALESFFGSLDNGQKRRFNTISAMR